MALPCGQKTGTSLSSTLSRLVEEGLFVKAAAGGDLCSEEAHSAAEGPLATMNSLEHLLESEGRLTLLLYMCALVGALEAVVL